MEPESYLIADFFDPRKIELEKGFGLSIYRKKLYRIIKKGHRHSINFSLFSQFLCHGIIPFHPAFFQRICIIFIV